MGLGVCIGFFWARVRIAGVCTVNEGYDRTGDIDKDDDSCNGNQKNLSHLRHVPIFYESITSPPPPVIIVIILPISS